MKRVTFLIPHDISGSIHGGKIRSRELIRGCREAGLVVTEVRIPQESADMSFLPSDLRQVPLIQDLALAYSSGHDQEAIDRVLQTKPDVLVLEHPWLWGAARRAIEHLPHCQLVYSSQNIEWRLKRQILQRYAPVAGPQAVTMIAELEQSVAESADLVLATSESDANELRSWTSALVCQVPNGVDESRYLPESPRPAEHPFAVVVGSSHPPNIEGCIQFLGDPCLWLPPMTEIWIMGSLSSALASHWGATSCSLESGGLKHFGEVPSRILGQALTHANAVLVPVSYGEGSNLKTAEALYVGRPVVASTVAMRTYEACSKFENVVHTNSPLQFKISTTKFLLQWHPSRAQGLSDALTWDSARRSLISALEQGGIL